MPAATYCFTYLHDSPIRKVGVARVNPREIQILLPGDMQRIVKYDERDRRVLVIFDGDIPCNGLPKNGNQICILSETTVSIGRDHVRKGRVFELAHPHPVGADGQIGFTLMRRVVLLPAGNALVVRYRPDSLAAWYCLLEVAYTGLEVDVTFRNATY